MNHVTQQYGAHTTVLLHEAIDALVTDVDGVYVDGTFGRGGHTRELLSRLSEKAVVYVFDKDLRAIECANELAKNDARVKVVHASFAELASVIDESVTGILVDLGVSSPQLDEADRGFSFQHNGPLDMRMDVTKGMSASEWLAMVEEADLVAVLKEYGEERFAKRIARAIVETRGRQAIDTTHQLASIISDANPRHEKHKHPATRSFQAIRIYINKELDDLALFLSQAVDALSLEGRLVVISFHSLEDRIVKRFYREQSQAQAVPSYLPITEDEKTTPVLKLIGKAVKPSNQEIQQNPRSRSAIMRVAKKQRQVA